MAEYNPREIEAKWQQKWLEEKVYEPNLSASAASKDAGPARPPFYNLMMFPYPSAEGLHVGNMYAFTGSDIYGRMKRMQGNDVFEPIGLDGFGIHSENYAIKIGAHPMDQAAVSEKRFYEQLKKIGNGYAWDEHLETYDPEYYRWTQWIFTEMFRRGLAYRKKQSVNWCPKDQTVLADEQVEAGKCERCGTEVVKKELEQWFFRITQYADRLLANIEKLDWSEKVKIAQTNWIGKAEGAEVSFKIAGAEQSIKVFTTRPDTLFGATYLVVAPEHSVVQDLAASIQDLDEVHSYIENATKKSERMRQEDAKEKTGVSLKGIVAINPVNKKEIPIWVADYVLVGYGTGAVMGVPGHDERDFQFARKFDLPIVSVIEHDHEMDVFTVEIDDFDDSETANAIRELGSSNEHTTPTVRLFTVPRDQATAVVAILNKGGVGQQADHTKILEGRSFILTKEGHITFLAVFKGDGIHINSEFLNGLRNDEAIEKIIAWLEKDSSGVRKQTYRLRDWLISRQRYWGPPIPMIFCEVCAKNGTGERDDMPGWYAVLDKFLPVVLPRVENFRPTGSGVSPLAADKAFNETICPQCNAMARRETDVSDTFLDSAWYYLRYLNPDNEKSALDEERIKKWLPAGMYIGGAEHAVLHLLYVRFVAMVLHDWKLIEFEEPFQKFRAHGLVIKDGAKMSKSKGNVINPDEYIENFGADTLRMYLMFLAPFQDGGDFRDSAILGIERFLKRVFKLETKDATPAGATTKALLHKTIKKVTEDIESLHYNTAVSSLMILLRGFEEEGVSAEDFEMFLKLLAPFAPHITEELWREHMKHASSIHREPWPQYDPALIKDEKVKLALQVNGKTRDVVEANADELTEDAAKQLALTNDKIKKSIGDAQPKKIIYVDKKLVNIVV